MAATVKMIAAMMVAILVVVCGPWDVLAQNRLLFCGEENVYPYSYRENGQVKGLDCDLVREAARRMKIAVEIDLVPWKRMYESVRDGSCDAGFAFFYLKERETFGLYVRPPLHTSAYSVFVRKGKAFAFSSIDDLYGKKVGNVIGYRIGDAFDEAVDHGQIMIEETTHHSQNVKKLVLGRIDCIVSNRDMMLATLRDMGLVDEILPLSTPVIPVKKAYLVVSRKANTICDKQAFARQFTEVLQQMKDDGTYRNIFLKNIGVFIPPS